MNEANYSFRTIEVERLTANELFKVSRFCYRSSSRPSVPVGITSTLPLVASLSLRAAEKNAITNQMLDGS
ncbi:hypothetical protein Tco_0294302 [Tanacetum coccineum]